MLGAITMVNVSPERICGPDELSLAEELAQRAALALENAGLYKDLNTLKDLVISYRQSTQESERERLFESIEEYSQQLNLNATAGASPPS